MEETKSGYQVYLDALIMDTEPVVLHRGGVSKYLKSIEDRRHESFSYYQWFEVWSPPSSYEVLESSQGESWNNLIEHRVPHLNNEYYRSEDFCDGISLYHKTEPISWSGNFYESIDEYCLWVAAGVWYHRQNYTNFRNAYKHEVCAAYFNYPAEQINETNTTIFTGPLDKVSRIADFMDTLGTPSLRFVASPVITVPSDYSYREFDDQASALSRLLEWCSNGEYWIGGGAVVKHETGRCGCPKCIHFRKW
jgi:hypothetical protein